MKTKKEEERRKGALEQQGKLDRPKEHAEPVAASSLCEKASLNLA